MRIVRRVVVNNILSQYQWQTNSFLEALYIVAGKHDITFTNPLYTLQQMVDVVLQTIDYDTFIKEIKEEMYKWLRQ